MPLSKINPLLDLEKVTAKIRSVTNEVLSSHRKLNENVLFFFSQSLGVLPTLHLSSHLTPDLPHVPGQLPTLSTLWVLSVA